MNTERTKEFRYYMPLAGLFVSSLLISNTIATKIFQIGPMSFTGGVLIFPICYILGDVLTEVYGYSLTRRIIWTGFFTQIFMIISYWIIIILPPAYFWPHQKAISSILGLVPRIVAGSLVGYLAGEFLNAYIMARMKIWTQGKLLWTRTIASTLGGEGLDTILFISIAFIGIFSLSDLVRTAVSIYLFKVIYEILITPLTYLIVAYIKKKEGSDYFDVETKFSPLKWS